MRLLYWFVGIAAVLAGIAVFVVAKLIHRGKAKQESLAPSEPVGLTSDQCLFVQERVERYRDEMLYYELGIERHRRNTSKEILLKILDGKKEIRSMPILHLNNDDWMWKNQQLSKAVDIALRKLGLSIPTDVKEPTARSERACEQWAADEAKTLFDEFLGTNT